MFEHLGGSYIWRFDADYTCQVLLRTGLPEFMLFATIVVIIRMTICPRGSNISHLMAGQSSGCESDYEAKTTIAESWTQYNTTND